MMIIGHSWLRREQFICIKSRDSIELTPAGSILLFEQLEKDIELILYAQAQNLPFAIRVNSITEAIFAHNLKSNYIFVEANNAKEIQDIAQHYLFDTQVLVEIASEDEIATYAKLGIDGVVLPSAIELSYCQ